MPIANVEQTINESGGTLTKSVFKRALYHSILPISLSGAMVAIATPVNAQIEANSTRTNTLAADSPFQDPDIIYLEADELINNEELQILTAAGEVEGRYQDRTLRADRVIYNLSSGSVVATGNVVLVDSTGASQYADKLERREPQMKKSSFIMLIIQRVSHAKKMAKSKNPLGELKPAKSGKIKTLAQSAIMMPFLSF